MSANPRGMLLGIGLTALGTMFGCGGEAPEGTSAEVAAAGMIPQPSHAQYAAAGVSEFPFAPDGKRIDLAAPSFSDPATIDSPLNPITEIPSAVVLGEVDGDPLRIEITLLPETRAIEWNGTLVECAVSQFVAYREGRMKEVAIDYYAQADDGAVWYFGEDVFNYAGDGHIADMDGAWLAGRDGPPGMITAADPQVGDAYRSENVPGLAFEESTVEKVDATVEGPRGPISGAYVIDEHHPDGPEIKKWAPGYGEFFTRDGRDVEQLALAVPVDALTGQVPAELERISSGAAAIFEASPGQDWPGTARALALLRADWRAFHTADVPRLLAEQMARSLAELDVAVGTRDSVRSRLAAIAVGVASLDLQLRHRPPAEIDLARLDLQAAMLAVDVNAHDLSAIRSDVANLDWIRDRIAHVLDPADLAGVDGGLAELVAAIGDEDLGALGEATIAFRATVDRIEAVS